MKNKILLLTIIFTGLLSAINLQSQTTDNFPGTALDFDGTDDYVETSLDDLSGSEITIEYWFKGSNTLSAVRQQDAYNYIVAGWNDTHILSNDGGLGNGIPVGAGAEDGNWHHIAMTWKQNTTNGFRSYLDGDLVAQRNSSDTPLTNIGSNVIFGSFAGVSEFMNGVLEEIRIWDIARDSVQIRESMYLPVFGPTTGLISYWQFNNGSGTVLTDIISGNDGDLINMDENDWIVSTIPFGDGVANSQIEADGTVDFTDTRLSMDFNSQNGASITVTRIDTIPNLVPTEPETVFDAQYWVVNRFGSGTFNADLTFTINEDLTAEDESYPSRIRLYTRASNADTNWVYLMDASSVNAAADEAVFNGITSFSQFIIGKISESEIVLLKLPFNFELVPGYFNSIDVGYFSSPSFTDIDGDGLLDLLIGEGDSYLNHYEQDSENSTSFSYVTNDFNSIDVGQYSKPTFTDLDGDGLLDLIIGELDGYLNHYEQDSENSTSFSYVTDYFNSIDVGLYSSPTFTDLDGDGLLDLIIGEIDGKLYHYEQDSENSTSFSYVTNYFNSIDVGNYSTPSFTDLDGDGLLDLLIGEYEGKLYHYEQDSENSISFSLVTQNFNSIDVGDRSEPTFTDLDSDGLLDLIIGEYYGNLYHYEQEGIDSFNFGERIVGTTVLENYYISAYNLVAGLNIDCPEGFRVSLSSQAGFLQNLTLTPVNGIISDTIFVRFEPDSLKFYNGDIVYTSLGAVTEYLPVSGSGGTTDNFPGTALDFDGIDDYVLIGIDFPQTNYTYELYFKTADQNAKISSVRYPSLGGTNDRNLYLDNGDIFHRIWDTEIIGSTGQNYADDIWHHVAVIVESGVGQRIYVDGTLVATGTKDASDFDWDTSLDIGYNDGFFDGKLDEVRLWNVVRTETQIRENIYHTLTDHETGIISYWQFNNGSGTTLFDVVGGNNGTLQNMSNDDWIESTVPVPYFTIIDGDWEINSIWAIGQNAPVHPWSRAKIKHNITLNINIQLIEIKIDNNALITISNGNTLTISGENN